MIGNERADSYKKIVDKFIAEFSNLGVKETVKIHFLSAHLDYFCDNNGKMSDEQGERFHQDLAKFEKKYQGHCNAAMLADYTWTIKPSHDYKFSYINK